MTDHRRLTEEEPIEKGGSFSIPKDTLSNFFERHEIESNATATKIKSYGGIAGLFKKLKSDLKTGLDSTNISDLTKRAAFYEKNEPVAAQQRTIWQLVNRN